MASTYEFSNEIRNLIKEGNYLEAIKFFEKGKRNFSSKDISNNIYIISSMIDAYCKTNNFTSAFNFIKSYNITIDENTHKIILTQYGWMLYFLYKYENDIHNTRKEYDDFDEERDIIFETNKQQKSETITLIEKYLKIIIKYLDDQYFYKVFSALFKIVLKTEKKGKIQTGFLLMIFAT